MPPSHAAARAIHHVQRAAARQHPLSPLDDAERGGWGLQAALGRAVAALTGAPRAAFMEDARHEGQRDAGQGPPRCVRPLTRTLAVPDEAYTEWSHSYGARGAWPNSNLTLTLPNPNPNPT